MDDTFHISRRQYEYDDSSYAGYCEPIVYDMTITTGNSKHNIRFTTPEPDWDFYCKTTEATSPKGVCC